MKAVGMPVHVLALLGILLPHQVCLPQGSLTPPGPPGPTMKTLGQIEPRTPISSAPYSITAPGSYYFTTNLLGGQGSHGVIIQADNVALDLNGFSLVGNDGALKGISVPGIHRNIAVRNGTISNWAGGIDATNASFGRFESLRIFDTGGDGIAAGANSTIQGCSSCSNEGAGINVDRESTVRDCFVRANVLSGIRVNSGSQVVGCTASFNSENGIIAEKNCLITDCNLLNNTRAGLVGGEGSQVSRVSASSNRDAGIIVSTNSVLNTCTASLNSSSGIVSSDGCQLTAVTASYNGQTGILMGAEGQISNGVASHNQEYGIVSGADVQILGSKALANKKAGIWADSGSTIRGCTAQRNGSDGILVSSECTVAANYCRGNFNARDAAGIHATGTDNSLVENNVVSNDRGVSVDVGGNIILKNTASNNTIGYFIAGSQTLGTIFKGNAPVDVASPWTNFEF